MGNHENISEKFQRSITEAFHFNFLLKSMGKRRTFTDREQIEIF
jgi:hypothetical protein